jgi:hypothetical protein
MKRLKNFIAATSILAMIGSSAQNLSAQEFCSDAAGCGYEQCRSAPCLTPAIALGAIALVAIIAVAVQNTSNSHGHSHSHCGCSSRDGS